MLQMIARLPKEFFQQSSPFAIAFFPFQELMLASTQHDGFHIVFWIISYHY